MKREVIGPIEPGFYKNILSVMPVICVDLLIQNNKSILLIKRKNSPAKNQWWFPGGRILKGESIKEAAERKALEEVGVKYPYSKTLGVEDTYFNREEEMEFDVHTINIICLMEYNSSSEIRLDFNHSEYEWVNIDNIDELRLHKGVEAPIKSYFNNGI